MCHPFLHYSHRAVSPSDFNLLRTTIAKIAIIVVLKDHLALLACQSGSGKEGYNMIINTSSSSLPLYLKEVYLQFVQLLPFP